MAFRALFSNGSPTALLRLLPFLFPAIFVSAAVTDSIAVLYFAVALHLIIIGAENTIGRFLSNVPIAPLVRGSTLFEDTCLFGWPVFHLSALAAALYLITRAEPTAQQTFAIAAIFGYSVNIFSATVGHELLHRHSRIAHICSDLLYSTMLYPHFPSVHLASHHAYAGSGRDCQTPRPGQQIYPYLGQALVGGLRIASKAQTAVLDPHLRWRILAAIAVAATLASVASWCVTMFLIVQGLFSFILIETLNYVQHYRPLNAHASNQQERSGLANQDLNFVSRCVLFNLSLHASHHVHQNYHYSHLNPVPRAPTCCWGYWTSFWLAWTPPLWNHLHSLKARGEA